MLLFVLLFTLLIQKAFGFDLSEFYFDGKKNKSIKVKRINLSI